MITLKWSILNQSKYVTPQPNLTSQTWTESTLMVTEEIADNMHCSD